MGRSQFERAYLAILSGVIQQLSTSLVHDLARECGFDLVGVAGANPVPDFGRFRDWADRGLAGEMRYLTDRRAELRSTAENLMPGVKSIISVGLLYNGPQPYSTDFCDPERAWIARYAWGEDYHAVLRAKLELLASKLLIVEPFSWRACVDTAPLLERSIAREAGLGWIGKNTCLINQELGSWFFLAELLTTVELVPDTSPPDRCGTCTRCIDACPTEAIVPSPLGRYDIDSRLCISYFTIELRSSIPEEHRAGMGRNVFGCDICQDVCPWNRKAAVVGPSEESELFGPPLERLASLTESEFKKLFQKTAVSRARYSGFLRNVAIAMGNSHLSKFDQPLRRLAASEDPLVAEHARWAIDQLQRQSTDSRSNRPSSPSRNEIPDRR